MGDWVPLAAVAVGLGSLIYAVFVRSPMVPRSRWADLGGQIAKLQGLLDEQSKKIERQTNEITTLTARLAARDARIDSLMGECEYWREKYRVADEKLRSPRAPRT